ncbi:hypothetical protein RvVAR0630_18280 [Agrobacterium vitis]|uniref:hypothetical protein n=1 Tax=Agrobacterium vitis TaxID=373 RepID=UPI0015D8941B|nr:hypothetical protein [Agrobacterium vitis]BCH59204.1 hypothetical protein RvVAR0630_18280 [Agrobacterium vitis]
MKDHFQQQIYRPKDRSKFPFIGVSMLGKHVIVRHAWTEKEIERVMRQSEMDDRTEIDIRIQRERLHESVSRPLSDGK